MSVLRHRRRWFIVALLFTISVVNYLDRQTLSVLSHTLRSELGFTEVQYSYVVTSFLVAYTIGFAVNGRIIDRIGVKTSIAIALVFWSTAGILHALAAGWVGLALCRFLLGLGESANAPASARAISEWVPRRERGLSMAIMSNGFMVGAVIAPPIVSLIALQFGWQWSFIVTGSVGFVLLAIWLWFYDSPDASRFVSPEERAHITATRGGEQEVGAPATLLQLLSHPLCYGLIIARFLTDPLSYFLTFWLPEYLQSSREFSLAMIGLLGWIPFLAADVGGPGGGAVSDWLVRRGIDPRRARLTMMFTAACVMPLAAVAVRVDDSMVSLALIAVMLGAHSCWTVNLLTLISESFPRRQVATVVALASMGGSIGGILSTLLTGQVITAYGYVPVFTMFGGVHLSAIAILFIVIKRAERRVRSSEARGVEDARQAR